MTVFEALAGGMRALARHKRLCVIFYIASTAAALLIAAPLMSIALQSLGDSALAQGMAGNLDIAWLSELFAQYGGMPWMPTIAVMIGVGAIAVVVYLFLLGGALQVLSTGEPFFAGCGRNFWRMVRLALVSLIFYAAAVMVSSGLGAVGRKIWGEGSVETPLVHWYWFRAAVLLLLVGCVNLVFDYARVRMVVDHQRGAFRAAFAAIRLVWRNRGRTAALYAVVCAIASLCFAAYLAVSHSVAQTSMALVLVLLAARQAMVVAKIWSRLLFCSTAIELYGAIKPPPPVMLEPAAREPELELAAHEPAASEPSASEAEPATAPSRPAAPGPSASEAEPALGPRPEPAIEIVLAPGLGLNAFQFITAWNQTPECRAAAEARLPGVVFDPGTLTGGRAVLTRVVEGTDEAAVDELIGRVLGRPVAISRAEGVVLVGPG